MKDTLTNTAKKLKVAVFGDIMLDQYVDGSVTRLSPEAPTCLVLDEAKRSYAPGGAANVALNLSRFGCEVRLCGSLGSDLDNGPGEQLVELLMRERVDSGYRFSTHILKEPGYMRCATVKTRFRSGGQQLLRVDREDRMPVKWDACMDSALGDTLGGADILIFSDYGKGVLSDDMIDHVLEAATDIPGLFYFVDPKRKRLSDYSRPKLGMQPGAICPNNREWFASEERQGGDLGCAAHIVVTAGEDGCFIVERSDDPAAVRDDRYTMDFVRPKHPVHVADPTGAGDTFIAAFAVASKMLEDEKIVNREIREVCEIANCVAGLTVAEHGVYVPTLDEIEDMLSRPGVVSS